MDKEVIFGLILGLLALCGCIFEEEKQASAPVDEEYNETTRDSTTAIYRQFFFRGTHNSYSGNLNGMQREGIKTQLNEGLRFLEFDLFPYYTREKLNESWSETVDQFLVFEYQEESYLITYDQSSGRTRIYELTDDGQNLVSESVNDGAVGKNAALCTLPTESKLYVFSYLPGDGSLTIANFDGESLKSVFDGTTNHIDAELNPFIYDGQTFLSVYDPKLESYEVYQVSLDRDEFVLNDAIYTLSAVDPNESISPFIQNSTLYLFRHNSRNVANFSVVTLDTAGDSWTTAGTINSTSDALQGSVTACLSNGKTYVCSYTASGDLSEAQLVMDNDKPNLVLEYESEIDLLSGAEVQYFPSKKGYYALLQKNDNVQLALVNMGTLALGHDAPGDEVDLDVDNPSSIVLSDWIDYIANWCNQNPDHEPLFIMTELKDYGQWIADAKWQNIILLMQEKFGDKLRYHNSSGFQSESIVDQTKIVDGETRYFMDENGDEDEGLPGKVILYIQPNNNITKSAYTNDFEPFVTTDGELQENFLQLKRYREGNKLVSPDWRYPKNYSNDIGNYIDNKDDSYISRIFHMENSAGDSQYDNIQCTDVMFAVSDRPFDADMYQDYVAEQEVKNKLVTVRGCE